MNGPYMFPLCEFGKHVLWAVVVKIYALVNPNAVLHYHIVTANTLPLSAYILSTSTTANNLLCLQACHQVGRYSHLHNYCCQTVHSYLFDLVFCRIRRARQLSTHRQRPRVSLAMFAMLKICTRTARTRLLDGGSKYTMCKDAYISNQKIFRRLKRVFLRSRKITKRVFCIFSILH
jgi:hypothetical protein